MLHHLHATIRTLIHERGRIDADEIDVRFERPTRQWVESLTQPTINLFLFDLAENSDFRNASAQTSRNGSKATTRLRPRRFDLRYLVCGFSSLAEDEYQLVWRALAVLLKHTTLPPELLAEELRTLDVLVAAKVGAYAEAPRTLEVWGALDLPPRPSLLYTVTAPLDLEVAVEAPLVLSRATRFTRSTSADERMGMGINPEPITEREPYTAFRAPKNGVAVVNTLVDLVGVVLDASGEPLPGVLVGIVDHMVEATTDVSGLFRLPKLRQEQAMLRIRRENEDYKVVGSEEGESARTRLRIARMKDRRSPIAIDVSSQMLELVLSDSFDR